MKPTKPDVNEARKLLFWGRNEGLTPAEVQRVILGLWDAAENGKLDHALPLLTSWEQEKFRRTADAYYEEFSALLGKGDDDEQ